MGAPNKANPTPGGVDMYDISALSFDPITNPEWFTRSLFGGRLIEGGYTRVMTGIKGEERLSSIDMTDKVLQADGADCAWTPEQIIKLTEKIAKVKTYKINLEQCIDELEKKRTAYLLSPGAKNDELPSELEQATMFLISVELSNEIEEMIIAGDETVNPDEFDGFYTLLRKSATAIKIPGVALTKANVLDAFESVYNALPEDVLQTEDAGTVFFLCSYNTRRLVRAALAEKGNQVIATAFSVDDTDKKNPKIYYLGVEIVPVKGLDNTTIIGYDNRNAYFLTDLMSDTEMIRLGVMPAPKDNTVFIDGRMRLGFVILFDDEVVLYSATTTYP